MYTGVYSECTTYRACIGASAVPGGVLHFLCNERLLACSSNDDATTTTTGNTVKLVRV